MEDKHVIHIDNNQSAGDHVVKDRIHHSLEGCQGITHSKEHNCWFE